MIIFEKVSGEIKEKEILRAYIKHTNDGKYILDKYKKVRSNQSNKYYRVLLSYITHETGDLDMYGLHQYLKARFMKETTTDMDTIMFTDYIHFVKQFALFELGIETPDAL